MSKQENNDKAYASDKKMLYRYPKDDYYADNVSLENGKICMQVGGHTICKSIKDWHKLGNDIKQPFSSSAENGSKQESDIETIYEDWNEVDGKIYYRWRRKDESEWHIKLTAYKEKPVCRYRIITLRELKELEAKE